MVLTEKQTIALDYLEDNSTTEVLFGGGAGSAKSFLGCYWILKMCLKYPGSRWLMGRKKLSSLKQTTLITFLDVAKLQGVKNTIHFEINSQSNTIKFWNGSEIIMKNLEYQPSDPDYDDLGGIEITGALLEECAQIPEKAYNIIKSRIRYKLDKFGLIPKLLMTTNPSKNWVYKDFYVPNKKGELLNEKKFVQALATDNPHISVHYIENLKKLPNAQKQRLLYGNWEVDDDANSLVSYDQILDVFTNTHAIDLKATKYMSCDVARLGNDLAVVMVWRGLEVMELYSYPLTRLNELAGIILALKHKHTINAHNIVIDASGVGGGVSDLVKNSKEFIGNQAPANKENYQNLKTQCMYLLANKINDIYISAKISDETKNLIISELEQLKADDVDSDGKMKVISKDQIKQNIGHSPDFLDTLMMRMYFFLKVKTFNPLGIG